MTDRRNDSYVVPIDSPAAEPFQIARKDVRSAKLAVALLWVATALSAVAALVLLLGSRSVAGEIMLELQVQAVLISIDVVFLGVCAWALSKGRYGFGFAGAAWMAIGLAFLLTQPNQRWPMVLLRCLMIGLIWRGSLASVRLGDRGR